MSSNESMSTLQQIVFVSNHCTDICQKVFYLFKQKRTGCSIFAPATSFYVARFGIIVFLYGE